MTRIYNSLIFWLKGLWSAWKKSSIDFVAIADNKVCVSGKKDNFTAIKENDIWSKGYPGFNDLMDNYNEVKDLSSIKKYSLEARKAIQSIPN